MSNVGNAADKWSLVPPRLLDFASVIVNIWRMATPESRRDQLSESILEALRGLRFGSVEIVVHEARVVQIVRTEKVRVGGEIPGATK